MNQSFDDSVWNMVWGGTVGLMFRINQRVEVNLGYRVLVVPKTTYEYQGQGYGFGKRAMDILSLGVNYRF